MKKIVLVFGMCWSLSAMSEGWAEQAVHVFSLVCPSLFPASALSEISKVVSNMEKGACSKSSVVEIQRMLVCVAAKNVCPFEPQNSDVREECGFSTENGVYMFRPAHSTTPNCYFGFMPPANRARFQ